MEKLFNEIYNKYSTAITNWVASKIKPKEDVEEIVQDFFVKVYNKLVEFDENKSTMKTWIFNITKNTLIDHYRKNTPELVSIHTDDETGEPEIQLTSPDYDPLAALMNSEALNKIKNAIQMLPENYCHIASLFYISNFSILEIAAQESMPEGTVKTKLYRTRQLLRSLKLTI